MIFSINNHAKLSLEIRTPAANKAAANHAGQSDPKQIESK
jgi:hypothetical protein